MTLGQQIAEKYFSDSQGIFHAKESVRRSLANLIDTMHAAHAQKAAERLTEIYKSYPFMHNCEAQTERTKEIILGYP